MAVIFHSIFLFCCSIQFTYIFSIFLYVYIFYIAMIMLAPQYSDLRSRFTFISNKKKREFTTETHPTTQYIISKKKSMEVPQGLEENEVIHKNPHYNIFCISNNSNISAPPTPTMMIRLEGEKTISDIRRVTGELCSSE